MGHLVMGKDVGKTKRFYFHIMVDNLKPGFGTQLLCRL